MRASANLFPGPVEVDETYMGGKRKNMPASKRKALKGRGTAGKAIVVGAKDRATKKVRATVIDIADAKTLQGFVADHTEDGSAVYTDDAAAYKGMKNRQHEAVKHSVGEYVNGKAHTNGIESFWALLKRGYHGTYHHMSDKHLNRYIKEFAGRHNIRDLDTVQQMAELVKGLTGKRLRYTDLISEQGR